MLENCNLPAKKKILIHEQKLIYNDLVHISLHQDTSISVVGEVLYL